MPEVSMPELEEEDYYSVVIFNDDITPFDVVIFAIQKVTGISIEVAEMIAKETHESGQAVVMSGLTKEKATEFSDQIAHYTKVDGICPGLMVDIVK